MSKTRHAARIAAVQALYQMDMSGDGSEQIIREFREHRFGMTDKADNQKVDDTLFEDITHGVVKHQDQIDENIRAHLSKVWSLQRLDITLRAIMRAGTFEIFRKPDIPALVIIDEYVTIAHAFFEDKEPAFVNGALDKIAKKARPAEFGMTGAQIHHG